jgi:hypothetical protein
MNIDNRPWESEPYFHTFEAAGMRCVMYRDPEFKTWCGYVGVGSAHPLYGLHYSDLVPAPAKFNERPMDVDEHGMINVFVTALQQYAGEIPDGFVPISHLIACHGGLSWAQPLHEWTGWWFGFDCNHAWDYSPGMVEILRESARRLELDTGWRPHVIDAMERRVYRTFDFVKSETASLAQQVADYVSDGSAEAAREVIRALRDARLKQDAA